MSSTHARYEPAPPAGWNPPSHGPPPIPPGMNVNPQVWGRGAWQFNPAFNNAGRPPQQAAVPWVAGFGWHGWQGTSHASVHAAGQSAAAAAPHNPYKRVPRPPSAEYMATKLVDNPLGLTNMIPRDELRGQDGYPQSPWIWNPPGLISDESDDGVITADFRDAQGRRVAQEVRGSTPSRQASQDREADGSSHHENTQLRHSSTNRPKDFSPTHATYRHNDSPSVLSQNSRDSTPSRRSSNDSMSSGNRSTLPTLDRPLGRPRDPSSAYQQRFNSPNALDTSTRESPSRSNSINSNASSDRTIYASTQNEVTVKESFTSRGELHPTFSTNIVRTPDYYQSASRRNSHEEESGNRNGSSMSTLTSRMERLGSSHTIQNSTALTRHASMPSSSFTSPSSSAVITHPSDFVDEPTSILSPLMMATPSVNVRSVTRGLSVPDIRGGSGLSVIPEVPPTSRGLSLPPISTRTSKSPITPDGDRHTPPLAHPHNPLPRPPYEMYNPVASAPPPRVPSPPPGSYKSRVRLGFWNRRGDYLTRNMYVVYAPPEKAYPRELQGYPAEMEGFRDHLGAFVPYNPDRPELPESLPRHGKSPVQPYSVFIVYEYRT